MCQKKQTNQADIFPKGVSPTGDRNHMHRGHSLARDCPLEELNLIFQVL